MPPQSRRDRRRRVRGVDDDADLALVLHGAAGEQLHAEYDRADAKHPQRIDGDLVGARIRPEAPEHHPGSQQGERAVHEPDGGQGDASVLAAQRHRTSPVGSASLIRAVFDLEGLAPDLIHGQIPRRRPRSGYAVHAGWIIPFVVLVAVAQGCANVRGFAS